MELTLTQADQFVDQSPRAEWNGWNIEVFRPEPNAFMRPNGAFHNGRWCLKSTISPNNEGKYVVTKGNAASAAKSWN